MLKITSGRLKGKKLKAQKGCQTRPTLEKTRDALFNVLQNRYQLEEYEAYDLFSGSGALGFEAYSRGVSQVSFFENNRQSFNQLKQNIAALALELPCTLYHTDSMGWLKNHKWQNRLNLFLVDPPYDSQLAQETINIIASNADSLVNSLLVIETDKDIKFDYPAFFHLFQQKNFGKTRLDFFKIKQRACDEAV